MDDDILYISFCGTDDTLLMARRFPNELSKVSAQRQAIRYLNETAKILANFMLVVIKR